MDSEEIVQLFTSLLAVLALVGAVGIVVLRVLARSQAAAADLLHGLASIGLWLAFAVAATSMAGSLYFSEIANYVPCLYCWYQRIAMFPLTIVLLVAAIRKDHAVKYTAVPLAGIGAAISAYHIGLERGWLSESTSCDPTVPCSSPWFEQWGFVTLAVMAFCGFAAIIALVTLPDPHSVTDDIDDSVTTATTTPDTGPHEEI